MQGNSVRMLGKQLQETLVPAFGLLTGVREDQSGHRRVQPLEQRRSHTQTQMAGPRQTGPRRRLDELQLQRPLDRRAYDPRCRAAAGGGAGGLLGVAQGGRERPDLECGVLPRCCVHTRRPPWGPDAGEGAQMGHGQLGLDAPFAGEKLVPLIND